MAGRVQLGADFTDKHITALIHDTRGVTLNTANRIGDDLTAPIGGGEEGETHEKGEGKELFHFPPQAIEALAVITASRTFRMASVRSADEGQ